MDPVVLHPPPWQQSERVRDRGGPDEPGERNGDGKHAGNERRGDHRPATAADHAVACERDESDQQQRHEVEVVALLDPK